MESRLPIESMLSGGRLELARLQDLLIDIVYDYVQPDAMLYGGTAIWRCFNGGRFSEDIDIYVKKGFEKKFLRLLPKYGLGLVSRDATLPLNMRITDGRTEILFEAKVGKAESVITQYTKVNGSTSTIRVLSPTELLKRKIEAYEGRRYVRDIYDMVQMTNYLDKKDHYVRRCLSEFLKAPQKPVDEKVLSSLVYVGSKHLSFQQMIGYLKTWVK